MERGLGIALSLLACGCAGSGHSKIEALPQNQLEQICSLADNPMVIATKTGPIEDRLFDEAAAIMITVPVTIDPALEGRDSWVATDWYGKWSWKSLRTVTMRLDHYGHGGSLGLANKFMPSWKVKTAGTRAAKPGLASKASCG